jgi:hypothetical protein
VCAAASLAVGVSGIFNVATLSEARVPGVYHRSGFEQYGTCSIDVAGGPG